MHPRRLLAGLVAGVVAFAAGAPSAGAHVVLAGSDPADATSLPSVPREVTLRFNEAISGKFRQVRLLDARGRPVAGTRVTGAADATSLILSLPANLPRGAYEVTWEALSQDDGHVTGGALVLGLGAAVGPVVRAAPGTSAPTVDALLRWGALSLQLLLIGLVAMAFVLRRARFDGGAQGAASRARALRRTLSSIAPASAIGAGLGVAILLREAAALPGQGALAATTRRLLGERWGLLWILTELLLLALLAVGIRMRRAQQLTASRGALLTSASLLVALAVVHALGGHATSVSQPALHVAAATAHLLGAGLWLGGVAALALVLWPPRGRLPADAGVIVQAVRRPFSWLVGSALALAVLTGLVALAAQVKSIDGLLTTNYGDSLIAKTLLMAAAALFGLLNALLLLRLGRGAGRPLPMRLPRLMAIEVALGVAALFAAAELTASGPPRGPEFNAPRPVAPLVLARQAKDVLVSATARPNRVGTNVFTVTTASTRRVFGKPVTSVAMRLAPQVAGGVTRTLALTNVGEDKWTGGAPLNSAGRWRMTVIVTRPGGERLTAPLAWTVEPADLVLPVKYSARRIAPIANTAATVLLGVLIASLIALFVRSRLRTTRGPETLPSSRTTVRKEAT